MKILAKSLFLVPFVSLGLAPVIAASAWGQYTQNAASTKVDSSYPSEIRDGYKAYEKKCSTCHEISGLTRKLRSAPSQDEFWIKKMQAMPSTHVRDDEAKRILLYLTYDSTRQMSTAMEQNTAGTVMDAQMIAEGRKFYVSQSCNACHTIGTEQAAGGPALNAIGRSRTRQQLLERMNGMRAGADSSMPPLPSNTPNEQINALVAYLQTLTSGK